MTPTLAVVMVLMGIAIGIAIGWIAWRRPPRDAVYSYQSETVTLKIRADNLTDEELTRLMDNIEAEHKKLLNTELGDGRG